MHKEKDPGHNYFEQAYRICKQTPQSAKEIMFYVNLRSSLYLVIMKPHLCYATHIGLLVREPLKLKNRTSS